MQVPIVIDTQDKTVTRLEGSKYSRLTINTTRPTSGAGTAYPSREPEFPLPPPGFKNHAN